MDAKALTFDISVNVPLPQLWEAFKDLHNLMPRLLPGFIESSRIVEGPVAGRAGSVRDCKFSAEVPGISWTKELIEEVDDENNIFTYKVVEGEVLEKYSSFRVTWQFKDQLAGGGTDVHWTADIVPLQSETPDDKKKGPENEKQAKAEAARRESLYKDSAQLLIKQLETHLAVTREYVQPSAKDRLRDDLLLS